MSPNDLVSEEDVKFKIVIPILKALGYIDTDIGFEGRTGRGYADVVVSDCPSVIVVEAKSPRTRIDNYRSQLENYVPDKHRRDQATIAILTNGEIFNVYGIDREFYRHSLQDYLVLSFDRHELAFPSILAKLYTLASKIVIATA